MDQPSPWRDSREGGSNQRAHERIRQALAIELAAEMIAGPGRSFPAVVLDTSCGGTGLAFDEASLPRFHVGTPVEIRYRQRGIAKPLIALGQICHQSTRAGKAVLGIRFTHTKTFYRQLTPELWVQFNRRRARRVLLDIESKLESGGRQWAAPTQDISLDGLSLAIDGALAEELADYDLTRLFAVLPSGGGILSLTCLRVHQTPVGPAIRHGMHFDRSLTANYSGQQERIDAYVRNAGLR